MCVCIVCPAPLWVGGACLYVHACIGVCMYLSVSMYVCMYSLYVCIHVMRVVRLRHKLTYCFFPFSWVDPTHSGGGGGHETGRRDHIYVYVKMYVDYNKLLF